MNPTGKGAALRRGSSRAAAFAAVCLGAACLGATGAELTLPALPFPENALEPFISKKTISFHYGAHHKGYVDTLNKIVPGTEYESLSLEEIILLSHERMTKGDKKAGKIFNNASQAWNHAFMWSCVNNVSPSKPSAQLDSALRKSFGSFESFKYEFKEACVSLFGSGWVWLVAGRDGALKVMSTQNAMSPLPEGLRPLLVCDVWEHAYYLDYKNRRADFVGAYLDSLVDWGRVSQRYSETQQ